MSSLNPTLTADDVGWGSGRRCLFCTRQDSLTREHVMPQWIWREAHGEDPSGPTIADPGPSKAHESFVLTEAGLVRTVDPRSDQPLMRATSLTVRSVCRPCNNGWMARLEDQVKPILIRMNRERSWRLSSGEVGVLRRWVLKTGLMLEQTDPETALANEAVFAAVANDEDPPGTWYVGMGRAHREIQFRVMLSPLSATLIELDKDINRAVGEEARRIYAMEHVIAPWQLLFITRYSPFPTIAPARLDHDFIDHPRRDRPLPLKILAGERPTRFRDIPDYNRADLESLAY
jgi:hypothetical protein